MGDIGKVIIGIVVVAAVATAIALVGQFVIDYWPVVLLIIGGTIGLVVYRKRQRRIRNTV